MIITTTKTIKIQSVCIAYNNFVPRKYFTLQQQNQIKTENMKNFNSLCTIETLSLTHLSSTTLKIIVLIVDSKCSQVRIPPRYTVVGVVQDFKFSYYYTTK